MSVNYKLCLCANKIFKGDNFELQELRKVSWGTICIFMGVFGVNRVFLVKIYLGKSGSKLIKFDK